MGEGGVVGHSPFPIPPADQGEKQRLAFWQKQVEAIPLELLEITGWSSTDRIVNAPGDDGRVDVVPLSKRPRAVLFRVPHEGPARQQWELILRVLRREQSRRRLVAHEKRAEEEEQTRAREALRPIADEAAAVIDQAWAQGQHALELVHAGALDAERRRELEACARALRVGVDRALALRADYRATRRRLERIERTIQHFTDRETHTVYPGLYADINAFLDLQCLDVANVASDELRRKAPSPTRAERAQLLEADIAHDRV
jgi:hypothetical protein